jgi:hypothetical protein
MPSWPALNRSENAIASIFSLDIRYLHRICQAISRSPLQAALFQALIATAQRHFFLAETET